MSDTLQLKLQWTKLRQHIAPDGDASQIDYRKFLGRYFIDFGKSIIYLLHGGLHLGISDLLSSFFFLSSSRAPPHTHTRSDGDHSFFNGIVDKIRDAIFLCGGDLHIAFAQFDEDGDGVIEATEFKHALERIVGAFVVAFACFFLWRVSTIQRGRI